MSLHDKAILVSLSTPKYGLNRHDDTEAKAVAQRHGADSKSIGVTKRLLQGNPAFDAVRKFDTALHLWNREQTLPWNDDGTRLLPTLQYDAYMAHMRTARTDRERLVRAFLHNYDAFVQSDRATLGSMFRASDYAASRPSHASALYLPLSGEGAVFLALPLFARRAKVPVIPSPKRRPV